MGKWCLHASSFMFDRIIIKVAYNQDRHKSSGEFDFGPLVSMAQSYVFWNERMSSSACGWSKDLIFQYLFDWPSLMLLHIIHQGLPGSPVSNRLLNQEMSIEKAITCSYTCTLGIYAEGYIAFVFPVVCSFVTFRRVSGIYVKVVV